MKNAQTQEMITYSVTESVAVAVENLLHQLKKPFGECNQDMCLAILASLVGQTKAIINHVLELSCVSGHEKVAERAIMIGASVKFERGVQTPLHKLIQIDCGAKSAAQLRIARMLIDHGADVNAQDGSFAYRTPLHLASSFANKAMVELLLESGADASMGDLVNRTPASCIGNAYSPKFDGQNGQVPVNVRELHVILIEAEKKTIAARELANAEFGEQRMS